MGEKWHNSAMFYQDRQVIVPNAKLCERFRGFYPVVIDIETSGFDPNQNAILEIAAVTVTMDNEGWLLPDQTLHFHVNPFDGAIHNAHFDHSFLMTSAERNKIKRNPFHPFATFDTASLSGLVFGQTVLAKACTAANIAFDLKEAHSALYDTQRTSELFCEIVNRWKRLGGWPLALPDSQVSDAESK